MRTLMIIAATLAIAAIAFAGGRAERSWVDLERAARAARIDAALEPLDLALSAGWRLLPLAIIIVVVVIAARAAWLAVERRHRERWPRIGDGALPVRADDLPTLAPAALEAYHVTRLAEAVHRPPHTLHYAPRVTAASPATAASGGGPDGDERGAIPTAPTLRDLALDGFTPTVYRVILGYSMHGAVTAPLSGMLSTAVAGRPGSGKSTLLRLVAYQTLAAGGMVYILDPHGSIADDVRTAPVHGNASAVRDIDDMSRMLVGELDVRIRRYRAGRRDFTPILALVDEIPVIAATARDVVARVGRIVLEGRKVGMYCFVSGQGLPATMTGGRLVRDALSSRYVFRTTPDEARRCGLTGVAAKLPERLPPGVAVVDAGVLREPTVLAIPDCRPEDWDILARKGSGSGVEATGSAPRHNAQACDDAAADAPLPPASQCPGSGNHDEDAAIVERFRAGASISDLIAELAGGARGGRAYQEASRRVADALRRALDRE